MINRILLGALLLCSIAACRTDDNEAIKALDDQGFTDIQVVDRGVLAAGFRGCDNGDQNWYRAQATNANKKRVEMLVCCGGMLQFKGCTVRSK